MKVKTTKQEYDYACERIYSLIHSCENPIEPDSNCGKEIELLLLLIEKYEKDII